MSRARLATTTADSGSASAGGCLGIRRGLGPTGNRAECALQVAAGAQKKWVGEAEAGAGSIGEYARSSSPPPLIEPLRCQCTSRTRSATSHDLCPHVGTAPRRCTRSTHMPQRYLRSVDFGAHVFPLPGAIHVVTGGPPCQVARAVHCGVSHPARGRLAHSFATYHRRWLFGIVGMDVHVCLSE
jgi:hypothetical protein